MFTTKQFVKSFPDREQYKTSLNYSRQQQLKNPVNQDLVRGVRGAEFLNYIKNILINYGKVTKDEATLILSDPENIKMFEICFVHKSYDSKLNYELYEHFGDKIVDYSVSKYLYERFPKLGDINHKPELTLKIVSKLHLYVRSKAFLSKAGNFLVLENLLVQINLHSQMLKSILYMKIFSKLLWVFVIERLIKQLKNKLDI